MIKKVPGILIFLLVSANFIGYSPLFSQNTNPFIQKAHFVGQPANNSKQADTSVPFNKVLSEATEDTTKRTLFSSCFHTKDGQVIYQYGRQMVNYYNTKHQLVPIKTDLRSCANGWVADQQPHACYFHLDGSTGIVTDDDSEIKFNKNNKINEAAYQPQIVSVNKNEVKVDLTSDIHKNITFKQNGIETDYVIDKSVGSYIDIAEDIDIPKDAVLKPDKAVGNMKDGMWQGDYVLLSANGEELARFGLPLCYDAKESACLGYYKDEYKDGKHILHTVVPAKWLAQATYPVTVDPSVMGPVSRWALGKDIPSGLYPNFIRDSIQITIPGGITITRLYVSLCFTSKVLHNIYLKYGRMYLKTPCDSTPQLACDTTLLPGYCYIDTTNNGGDFGPQSPYFRFPLTCCFNPLCTAQSFYLTVGISRNCNCLPPGPDSTSFLWIPSAFSHQGEPFYAYIVGNTDQVNSWSVNPTTACSNKCNLTLNVNAEYGVPPYTITHPWYSGAPVTFGVATTCNSSTGSTNVSLTIPGCPAYCGNTNSLSVPPPVIYDFCHDTVKGLTAKSITINPVPKITVAPDSIIGCSGVPVNFKISSCVPNTVISWKGSDKSTGNDSTISYVPVDTINSQLDITYTAYSSYNGCQGDTDHFTVKINKSPTLSVTKDTTILDGNTVPLNAISNANTYTWYPSAGLSCNNCANPIASPSVTTKYYVTVSGTDGCTLTDSILIQVTPQSILIPNIFTPNGDGKNDYFLIQNLQYYPNSQLVIYDRWGAKVLDTPNYQNNWDGKGQSDGVYYYVLTLPTAKKYSGFIEILR